MEAVQNIWSRITSEIKTQVNEASLKMFMSSLNPRGIEQDTFVIEALNELCKDWLEKRFRGVIQRILDDSNPPLKCAFTIGTRGKDRLAQPSQPGLPSLPMVPQRENPSTSVQQERNRPPKGESPFNGKYTFDTFVVGKSNQFAHAVCQAVVKNPGTLYNPVFIYGGVGLGKTHLMQAIGQEMLRGNPRVRVAYLSSESFTNEFIDSIRDKKPNEFRAKYRRKDVLLIDDVQFLAGKEAVVEEFFHTFNELFQNKKQIVLTSDAPPKKISKLEERLVSRFEMGIVVDVQPPDLETRVAILKKAADAVSISVSDDILMYLAQGITTNIRVLEGAFNRVVAYSGVVQKPIDKDLVDQVLKDFLRENSPGKITIPWIQKRVAEFYDIPEIEMTSKRRSQNLVFPRQVAMRIAQMCTEASLSQIGEVFGRRDHTTVLHACEKIITKIREDKEFSDEFHRVLRFVNPESR
jgi:chromosomal replication initiator protein